MVGDYENIDWWRITIPEIEKHLCKWFKIKRFLYWVAKIMWLPQVYSGSSTSVKTFKALSQMLMALSVPRFITNRFTLPKSYLFQKSHETTLHKKRHYAVGNWNLLRMIHNDASSFQWWKRLVLNLKEIIKRLLTHHFRHWGGGNGQTLCEMKKILIKN